MPYGGNGQKWLRQWLMAPSHYANQCRLETIGNDLRENVQDIVENDH